MPAVPNALLLLQKFLTMEFVLTAIQLIILIQLLKLVKHVQANLQIARIVIVFNVLNVWFLQRRLLKEGFV